MKKKKTQKAGADMEVAAEIGQMNQSDLLNDSIGLASEKLRGSEVRELTLS